MIAYRGEKIKNAICYFAFEHFKRTGKYLSQTILYKFLAFLDFMSLKETGKPSLELEYKALERGPVPPEIYNNLKEFADTDCFQFFRSFTNAIVVVSKKEANLDYFSKYEVDLMNKLLDKYSISGVTQRVICKKINDDSHKIKAWEIAWNNKPNSLINYNDMFENLNNKSDNELSIQEENFLTYKGLKEISSCK